MRKPEEYQTLFRSICMEYYESCPHEPIVLYQYLITLVDCCLTKDGIVQFHFREDIDLPHASTSAYSDLIQLYRSIGFDETGKMYYPETYPIYLQIKNETRSLVHERGQQRRLQELEEALQTCKAIGTPLEQLQMFLQDNHTAKSWIRGLEQFMYQQSRTTEIIEWKLERVQFSETGIRNFERMAVQLLKDLQCDYDSQEEALVWSCKLSRLECLYAELILFSFTKQARDVRPCGTILTKHQPRSVIEDFSFRSYVSWIGGYVRSALIRSIN